MLVVEIFREESKKLTDVENHQFQKTWDASWASKNMGVYFVSVFGYITLPCSC